MQTPWTSIAMYLVASLLGAAGQFLYKSGADRASSSIVSYIANIRILGGVFCYVGVMVLFVAALKRGGSLTLLYPLYATTFIWSALIARWAYGTAIRPVHVAGMVLLLGGMVLMGRAP
ncbi:MAG TPA: hypothetical protein VNM14_24485 [Planctomycetota bacterium]|jgi:hypothetical protein|nr:hypothetical protein [Planctomycetota bacterium]